MDKGPKEEEVLEKEEEESIVINECRICFASIVSLNGDEPENLRSQDLTKLLTNPCSCKGSMSYVHELCLVKWLLAKNIRHCELCKKQFVIKEEVGSFFDICRELVRQTMQSKKRIGSAAIYFLYIYFLGKRLVVATRYLSRVLFRGLVSFVKAYLHLAVAEAKFIFKLISAPWHNDRINVLKKATIELLTRI